MSLYRDELQSVKRLIIRLHREMHNPGYIANTYEDYDVEREYEKTINLLGSAIEAIERKVA